MRIRRALLFMPGDDRRKIEKGAGLGADSIIMDLEDGVALTNKAAARQSILTALHEVNFGRSERLVRLNPAASELEADDLHITLPGRPDGYVLPKVEAAWQVQEVSARIEDAEREHGWPAGAIRLLALIETAKGVVNIREISESDHRLDALIFGAEDLAGDIGATRTPEGREVFYARSAVVIHAKAHGLQAIDTVHIGLNDLDGLAAQTREALHMGYTGKLAIHPRQVEIIHQIFTPSPEETQQAMRLIRAHEEHQAAGSGAFELDGRMVDMPLVRAAETVLARARAAGLDV
ncbi:MAG: CoA ester lyase [Anaerolineae bacterium]|nr:CoA ester lyase [Anaerolineae bacterium]